MALTADRVNSELSFSGGIKTGTDIIKSILAGASTVQICSILYEKGLDVVQEMLDKLRSWMSEKKYNSLQDFRGELCFKNQKLSFKNMGEAKSYFRAQYVKTYKE